MILARLRLDGDMLSEGELEGLSGDTGSSSNKLESVVFCESRELVEDVSWVVEREESSQVRSLR